MPVYYYRASDNAGVIVSGKITRGSEASVKDYLKASGLAPVEIKKPGLLSKNIADFEIFGKKFDAGTVSQFLSKLSFALGAGLRVTRALKTIRVLSGNSRLNTALNEIEEGVEAGGSLSSELYKQKQFPELIGGMAEIGESSGRLPEIFMKLSEFYENEAKLKDEIKQAMIYPAAVSVAILAVMVVSVVFVLPGYARIFDFNGAAMPLPTRVLLGASAFLSRNYMAIIYLLCFAAVLLFAFFNLNAGKKFLEFCKLKLPVVSKLYKKTVNMRFAYLLGILTGSGVDMLSSLELIKKALGGYALAPVIDRIINEVGSGISLSAAMESTGFFDPLMTGMISVGEETGLLSETVDKASAFLQHDLSRVTGGMSKLVEPLITVTLGLILAFVMLAVMLPSFSLTSVI